MSSAQYSVWVLVLQALQPVALMMLLAFILAMALASRVARQLVEPINAIDLNDPAGSETYEELTPCCPSSAASRGRSSGRCGI